MTTARAQAIARSVDGRAVAAPDAVADPRPAARGREQPGPRRRSRHRRVGRLGPTPCALAERQRLPVWAIPATGGGRLGFPEGHPNFQGILPPAIGPIAETLAGHDLILVAGASVFAYYPYLPGDLLPEGAELVVVTSDPDEAARAPMGEAIVADVALTLGPCSPSSATPSRTAAAPEPREAPMTAAEMGVEPGSPISGTEAMAALGPRLPRRRDRRPRGALGDARAPQPAAHLAARQLLLRRRRRPRLRPRGRGRRPDRAARPAGRLRRRRGLRPVRDHRLLERRRLRRAGHVPRPAQLRVRDPQVVLARRGRRERPRPRPAGARRRRGRRRLRRPAAARSRAARS